LVSGGLLVLALGMALSSVPITATVVILLSPRRRQSSLPFLAGWVLTIAVVALAAAGGALAMPLSRREQDRLTAAFEIIVGVALIAAAMVTLRRSRTRTSKPHSRLEALGSYGPAASFGIAFAMGFRPKALLLGIAAGLALSTQPLTSTSGTLALALYVAISASTVAVPIVGTLLAPSSMEPRLQKSHDWLSRNGLVVTAWVMMLIGLTLLFLGVSAV
jgi:Sap, sulfolipid-1-addressing protein